MPHCRLKWEMSVKKVSIFEVARKAGVSQVTIYNHFTVSSYSWRSNHSRGSMGSQFAIPYYSALSRKPRTSRLSTHSDL